MADKPKHEPDFTDPSLCAWELFEKSGRIAYYLLYKNLREK